MRLARYLQQGLVPRLVSVYLVFALLATGCMGLAAYLAGRDMLRKSVVARLETASRQKETDLNLWVDERVRDLRFLSHMLSGEIVRKGGVESLPENMQEHLEFFRAAQPDMREVQLLSAEGGRVIASTERASVGGFRSMYNYYAQGRHGPAVQSVYPSPESRRPIFTVSMPVAGHDGKLQAVLAVHLDLEPINRIIRARAGLDETGETYLVDAFNVMVASGRADDRADGHAADRASGQADDEPTRLGARNEGIARALSGNSGKGLYTNDAGVPVVGVYRWLPAYQMALMAEMSQDEAFAPARRLALVIVLVGALMAACLAAGMVFVSRRVAAPVLAVTRAAMAVADGDLSARAPVLTKDELGKLAVAFNAMAGELSGLYTRLEQEGADRWAILQGSFDGIAVASRDGSIEYLNPGMEHLFGYVIAEAPSLAVLADKIFPAPEDRQTFVAHLLEDMRQPSPPERLYPFLHRDGGARWCRFRVAPMPGGRIVINAQDITGIKASEERVRHMALHDQLTGLPNRQLFTDRLDQAVRRAKRLGLYVTLIYVDLDHFKGLNDTHGHAHGDRVLVETALRLRACVRDSDTVARLGGDEFVIILPDQQSPHDALPVARKILESLYQPELAGGSLFLGASLGLACYPLHGVDQDALLGRADAAMYEAKRAGGNGLRMAEGFPED